jgi:hypothetical protein
MAAAAQSPAAPISVTSRPTPATFPLIENNHPANILLDPTADPAL